MTKSVSPLRYPGGKTKIFDKVKHLIEINNFGNRTYVEPFAGGFGIGIKLLSDGVIQSAILNDFDVHIYHFWDAVINNTEALVKLINDTVVTIEERAKQKDIYRDANATALNDGFATLFLNRVNFSGIIKGGPIGGLEQNGKYKLACRFNKADIIKKIENIAKMRDKIQLHNIDASALIAVLALGGGQNLFFNVDPPYVVKGNQLYTSFYQDKDHGALAGVIAARLQNIPWIVTYDDCELIRGIYNGYTIREYELMHNAGGSIPGKEIIIANLPNGVFEW